jgi:SAM-dependent methyltransferase
LTTELDPSVVWHDVECGAYAADLPLWAELAEASAGPILDLGCGSGRVALYLGRRGHTVTGLDIDAGLVASLAERASELPVDASIGDATDFALGEVAFGLIVAPMQLMQLLDGPEGRQLCLARVAAHLAAGGLAAFAIVESMPAPIDAPPPLPDAREVDGWIYSSLPIDARVESGTIRVRRLRQTVSPEGELEEELYDVGLCEMDAATLESEAAGTGLRAAGRRTIPPTDAHVGSTVVLLEKEA